MDKVFERGMILPLEKTLVYHTSRELKKGDADNALPIRISEGESKKPDRNQLICEVILKGQDIPYSLPEGTTVELTVKMDVSGTCSLSAYFPDIDFLIEKVGRTKGDEKIDSKQLKEDILKEKKRLNEMGDLLPEEDKKKLFSTINELSEQVESKDEDTKRKTNSKLKSLKAEMDTYEDSTESTRLIEDFHQAIKDVEKMSQDLGGADLIKDQLEALKKE
ncbi:MAG: Hsp70 family protein [Candidatus Peribacteria bacterium]|jgi:molecular chaperone DnaK (HSP70)|nr:Hsp70 family protein [Candidatus Peribacteria bacterium]